MSGKQKRRQGRRRRAAERTERWTERWAAELRGPGLSARARAALEHERGSVPLQAPPTMPCPKISFASEDAAYAAVDRLVAHEGDDGGDLHPYPCARCHRWHNGHAAVPDAQA